MLTRGDAILMQHDIMACPLLEPCPARRFPHEVQYPRPTGSVPILTGPAETRLPRTCVGH